MVNHIHNFMMMMFVGLLAGAMFGVFYYAPNIDFTDAVVEEAFTFGYLGDGAAQVTPTPEVIVAEEEGRVLGDVDVKPAGFLDYPVLSVPKSPASVFAPGGATL